MTDVAWGKDLEQPPPKKRLVPPWVWVIGSGCLLMLVIGGGACIYLLTKARKWIDPDLQWAQVAEVMPMDGRPQGWMIIGMQNAFLPDNVRSWTLSAPDRGESVVLMHYSGPDVDEQRRQFLDTTTSAADVPFLGPVGRIDPKAGTIEVQGRTLQCVRYLTSERGKTRVTDEEEKQKQGVEAEEEAPHVGNKELADVFRGAIEGSNVIVDFTPEGSRDLDVVIFTRQGTSAPVPDEAVVQLLAPFRVGPAHGRAPARPPTPPKSQ